METKEKKLKMNKSLEPKFTFVEDLKELKKMEFRGSGARLMRIIQRDREKIKNSLRLKKTMF